jgi:hypothetical protein
MKKFVSIALFVGIAAMIFSSCGKYEDGPGISLASKKGRVANDWIMDKQLVDGVEQEKTGYEEYYIYSLEKDGTGTMKVEAHTATYGDVDVEVEASETKVEWEFDDKKEQIRMRTANADGEFEDWSDDSWATILRLTSKEMWSKSTYTYNDGTNDVTVETEMHMKSK